jgi:hypothetical protein
MPIYPMRNKETGEIEEHQMSYKLYDQFLLDNPHLERYHSAEHLHIMSDSMRMNIPKYSQGDSAFEHHVIDRIKATVPGNTLHKTHKTVGSKWI